MMEPAKITTAQNDREGLSRKVLVLIIVEGLKRENGAYGSLKQGLLFLW